ncbi:MULTISPECIES: ABC transporter permease [Rhodococcus]|jgi:ABC-2 type transport system permease protein|uniref:ABC transporter permease n=1 Tax=Rhodococcus oxybenzonivorans TaxID=1990687 RepID=A0A2S2BS41_9NOCA|nr:MULTISPECIES: ABC transporter permease [Rhodococcus]AWK71403.1 ABC transporter permease [Rhodococcus oxybenzonivorans]MDV7240627.1 ABC transporter permease [Rhodococcus oxybenzonivorans]MDV7265231.1 ABC transporter permease [Rhodococcus oxybenzonivorans]MDV7272900.1 ABC transporter permease [Rhodococcus oxybenzonivorans]MDV7333361.1 ABC transporter permease [Rhodococcus oxybenzonivorans]
MAVLNAERIKITSTRSPWWCTVIIVVLGLGLAAVIGLSAKASINSFNDQLADGKEPDFEPFLPQMADAVGGVSGFGVLVLMILATLAVTSEYRFGVIRTTFQAIPNRASVLVAKAGLIGAFGAVLTFVLTFGAYAIAKATAGNEAGAALTLSGGDAWRSIYGVPIYAFLCVVLAVGIGALLRQSAGAIALLLLWPLLIESLFNLFGSFGEKIMPFLPFLNANHFLGAPQGVDFHWGPWGSLVYFAVFVLVIFGASLVVVNKRDA